MQPQLRTGEALLLFDPELRVLDWNAAAEELTGLSADEVVGRHCWEALGGVAPDGELVCHPGCSAARLGREGWPVPTRELLVRGATGRLRVSLATISLREDGTTFVAHLLRPACEGAPHDSGAAPAPPALSTRQQEVLELLAEGLRAKEVALRLGLAESTVRNHIHALLRRLGSRSQLEALARARAAGLL